jgi:hypothetical protein
MFPISEKERYNIFIRKSYKNQQFRAIGTMRSFLAAVAVWLSTVAFIWAQGDPLGDRFLNERLRISFRPPIGWHLANEGLKSADPIEFWKTDEYGPRIQIYSLPFELDGPSGLDETQRQLSRALLKQFPDLRIVDEIQITHNGHPAVEVTATLDIGDTYYHVIQRCLLAEGRIHIITCASFESTFIYDLPLFRASMDSVQILGAIYSPDQTHRVGGHLLQPSTLGLLAIGCFISGVVMRQISKARLKRKRN